MAVIRGKMPLPRGEQTKGARGSATGNRFVYEQQRRRASGKVEARTALKLMARYHMESGLLCMSSKEQTSSLPSEALVLAHERSSFRDRRNFTSPPAELAELGVYPSE